jgi:hypothetical protein
MSGGVIIARNLWDDPAFQNEPFSEREAWVWMICEAAWKPREKRVGKVIVQLNRGQLAASIRFMAEAFSWHRNKADRFLKRLEKCNLIRVESGTGVNVITLCKYNEYQLTPKSFGTEAGQKRDRSGTNENKGEIREEGKDIDTDVSIGLFQEKPPKKTRRKPEVDLPEGWVPSDRNIQDATDKGLSEKEIEDEADRFRNHHYSKQSRYRDWDAAWRTWIGNALRYRKGGGVAGGAGTGYGGQRSSLAGIVARRRIEGR